MNYLEKAEKAIEYMASSESEYARLKALVKYAPERLKAYLATLELESTETTQAGKKTAALAHQEYEQLVDSFETVTQEYNVISEKRRRAELMIEMYRSVNSAMKRGNV